jgi:hypothetical protein
LPVFHHVGRHSGSGEAPTNRIDPNPFLAEIERERTLIVGNFSEIAAFKKDANRSNTISFNWARIA